MLVRACLSNRRTRRASPDNDVCGVSHGLDMISPLEQGYVGLTTGACLADLGNVVVVLDIDAAKIDRLRSLQLPFYEPGLREIVEINTKAERLSLSTCPAPL
jgi:UDP-glucose 6-dehydrogenase